MSNPVPLLQVDAFTSEPFRGNPAAVCLLDHPAGDDWMQLVAAEMNLSETAFVSPRGADFDLRWFTPTQEVELCGHATLASAHALWHLGRRPAGEELRFHTASGVLTARREGEWIALDFPSEPALECALPEPLAPALGIAPRWGGCNRMDYLVELDRSADLRAIAPDLAALAAIDTRGVIVTTRGDDGEHDFFSRFFAPAVGVPEDPVTGSAHCCLAPYWSARLGKRELLGLQCSPRSGVVGVRCEGERVVLRGHAALVFTAELHVR